MKYRFVIKLVNTTDQIIDGYVFPTGGLFKEEDRYSVSRNGLTDTGEPVKLFNSEGVDSFTGWLTKNHPKRVKDMVVYEHDVDKILDDLEDI